MPAQARLSWEAAGFGARTLWWMGRYTNPPAVETCFSEAQGVLSGRKRVPERQEVRLVPVMWLLPARRLLPRLVPARSRLESSRDEVSVMWGTRNKRPNSVLNATSAPWGGGGQASLPPEVSLTFIFSSGSLLFRRSGGRNKETAIKSKRWKEQKGNVSFSPSPRAGWLAACVACTACPRGGGSGCCIPAHHSILASAAGPGWPFCLSLKLELLRGNILKMKPNYLQFNFFLKKYALLYNQALEKLKFWAKSTLWFPVALWVAGTVPNCW